MKNNTFNNELLNSALKYQKRFHVLPVKSGDKHPRFGWKPYQEEKPSEDWLISKFDEMNPDGLVAVTGKIPGIFVVDIDPGAKITPDNFPKTLSSKTGRGGYHLYYNYPTNVVIKSQSGWKDNVDIRADGGLIKLPPSKHKNGKLYEWVDETTPIAEPPQWLIDELTNKTSNNHKMDLSIFQATVDEGERNSKLTSVCGKLLHSIPQPEWDKIVLPMLNDWNKNHCVPPLPESEVNACYQSLTNSEVQKRSMADNEKPKDLEITLDILESTATLLTNQFGQACYILNNRPYAENLPSEFLQRRILSDFHQSEGKGVLKAVVNQAIDIVRARLEQTSNEQIQIHTRIGAHENHIYYDIGNGEDFIDITPSGWMLVKTTPILFQHHQCQQVQVIPQNNNKDLKELFKFINISDPDDQLLTLVYLVTSFIPDIPRPIFNANGEQGSAKTTALKIIRSLIDPANPAIVSPPKDAQEFVQMASHNYMFLLDNLTFLNDWQSNAICRFVTGDGFSKRALYSNDEDFLYSFMRVVGLSGINQISTRPDLLDRSLIIKFERLSNTNRKTEKELWGEFNNHKPEFLGSLLTIVSKTLATVNEIRVTNPVRLADFHQYAAAAAIALGFSETDLDRALLNNTNRQNSEALESSGTAKVIMRFMEGKTEVSLSSTELFEFLKEIAQRDSSYVNFPKGSNWLWKKIVEVRPNLQEVGITCNLETTKSAHSVIHISNIGSHISNQTLSNTDPNTILTNIDDFESSNNHDGGMEVVEAEKEEL